MSELKIVYDSWELNKLFRISRSSKNTAETIEVQISKDGKIKDKKIESGVLSLIDNKKTGLKKIKPDPNSPFAVLEKLL